MNATSPLSHTNGLIPFTQKISSLSLIQKTKELAHRIYEAVKNCWQRLLSFFSRAPKPMPPVTPVPSSKSSSVFPISTTTVSCSSPSASGFVTPPPLSPLERTSLRPNRRLDFSPAIPEPKPVIAASEETGVGSQFTASEVSSSKKPDLSDSNGNLVDCGPVTSQLPSDTKSPFPQLPSLSPAPVMVDSSTSPFPAEKRAQLLGAQERIQKQKTDLFATFSEEDREFALTLASCAFQAMQEVAVRLNNQKELTDIDLETISDRGIERTKKATHLETLEKEFSSIWAPTSNQMTAFERRPESNILWEGIKHAANNAKSSTSLLVGILYVIGSTEASPVVVSIVVQYKPQKQSRTLLDHCDYFLYDTRGTSSLVQYKDSKFIPGIMRDVETERGVSHLDCDLFVYEFKQPSI